MSDSLTRGGPRAVRRRWGRRSAGMHGAPPDRQEQRGRRSSRKESGGRVGVAAAGAGLEPSCQTGRRNEESAPGSGLRAAGTDTRVVAPPLHALRAGGLPFRRSRCARGHPTIGGASKRHLQGRCQRGPDAGDEWTNAARVRVSHRVPTTTEGCEQRARMAGWKQQQAQVVQRSWSLTSRGCREEVSVVSCVSVSRVRSCCRFQCFRAAEDEIVCDRSTVILYLRRVSAFHQSRVRARTCGGRRPCVGVSLYCAF